MRDAYFETNGDVAISSSGDLALTENPWRSDVQQIYIRLMTQQGDYVLYPNLGASLENLYGRPQSPGTGSYGRQLIISALEREGEFAGREFDVKAIPVGPQTIRFDVEMVSGNRDQLVMSVEQDLEYG